MVARCGRILALIGDDGGRLPVALDGATVAGPDPQDVDIIDCRLFRCDIADACHGFGLLERKDVIRFVGTAVSRPPGLDVSKHGLTGESCPVVDAENDLETVRIIVSCHGDLGLLILVAQVSHVRSSRTARVQYMYLPGSVP